MEELNELQERSFYKAIERAGSLVITPKPKPLIICTCNPSNNWVKDVFYDKNKNGSLPSKWLYIQSKIFDNPYVYEDHDYMESLKLMPRFEYEVFVNGDWELQQKTGAEFYKEFNLEKHVKTTRYDDKLPLWLSIDENVHPYFSCTIWQIIGKKAIQIDELCMRNPNNTVTGMCDEIKKRYPGHISGMLITGDATSKKEDVKVEKGFNLYTLIRGELDRYRPQLRVPPSNPSVYLRGQFINTILYSNFGKIEIVIGENCKESIKDWAGTKQAADGTKLKTKTKDSSSGVSYEEFGHLTDTADYLLTTVFANDFVNYQIGGISRPITTGKNFSANKY